MTRSWRFTAMLMASSALVLVSVRAESEARPASIGTYAEAGVGATAFLGTARDYSRPGPALEIRIGRDLSSWLSLGLHLGTSSHEATVPPPPEGEYYQLHAALLDLRVGLLLDSVGLYLDGGAGVGMISSNILERVRILEPGERISLAVRAGAGVEYQLQNRHFAVGLGAQWSSWLGFDQMMGVSTRVYLRYTY